MKFFGIGSKNKHQSYEDLLDTPLYKIPKTDTVITWADSIEGTLITGAIGSGKSSGAGRHIAHAMLKSGFGMVILCAKKDERRRWMRYIEEVAPDRSEDVVIFDKQSNLRFNFLDYEMHREGEGAGEILNIVEFLVGLSDAVRVYQSGSGRGKNEEYWDLSLRMLISRCISVLRLSGEEISIFNMRRLVSSRFVEGEPEYYRKLERLAADPKIDPDKRHKAQTEINTWIEDRYFLQILLKISNRTLNANDRDQANLVINYWLQELPKIGEKTSGIIVSSFMGIVEPFLNNGILKDQFTNGLSEELLPENIYEQNKIVIIDFPIKEFKLAGVLAATIYKTVFQECMERRDVENEENPKPVGIFIDEYHLFCNPQKDSIFATTSRSSWVASVYITQNINNIYFIMGSEQPESRAKSLLGNLNLKYFASNDNYDTNLWASQMIGQHKVDFEHLSFSKDMEISKSKNQQMQYRVTPDHFTTLKTGRKSNKYIVENIVFKAGKTWGKNKQNFALVGFKQK
ncbi:type IV secretory system conjugative DNA transfer family protein [Tenacibaculum sp. ZS6-P6]|uniref:type IV secretory system conjugative DNA transfer family protein n=1 Tax=Tenacibaculum sp. ZS6-P6 TaxID=3447503 RepID=UPI003F9E9644